MARMRKNGNNKTDYILINLLAVSVLASMGDMASNTRSSREIYFYYTGMKNPLQQIARGFSRQFED